MAKQAKNTICLWYNGDAEEAARFYAETFPDSSVDAVHRAPGDYPSGKKGDVLTVEFTVMGVPCLGLNGGPAFKHSQAFSFQVATADQAETDRYWNAIVGNGGQEKRVRMVPGQMGIVLADYADRPDASHLRSRSRRRQARVRGDDADEKDRHRCHRGGTPRLNCLSPVCQGCLKRLSAGMRCSAVGPGLPYLIRRLASPLPLWLVRAALSKDAGMEPPRIASGRLSGIIRRPARLPTDRGCLGQRLATIFCTTRKQVRGWILKAVVHHAVHGLRSETMANPDDLRYTKIALNNGSSTMPALGFGTLIPDPVATRSATKAALEAGFRLLDTAERYKTEKEVGEGMQEVFQGGKIKREDVFVVTKLWNTHHRPELVKPAFEASLKKLGLDFVDLYLIHTPFAFQPGDEFDPRDANGNVINDQGRNAFGYLEGAGEPGR